MIDTNRSPYPKLTAVLPIRNEERFIEQTIKYLQDQDFPTDKLEIIVVDGQSDDKTREIVSRLAKSDSRIRMISNPKRLSSAARALGVSEATGEIVTFIDGHTYIDNSQLLKYTALLMDEKRVSVLSRPQFLDTPDNTFFQCAVAMARKHPLGHGLDSTIYTNTEGYVDPSSSGASYRRELFDEVGNFDDQFDACEDVEFNYRIAQAGYKSFTSPRLAVYYYPRDSFGGLFRQLKRYGVGRFRLARKHPRTLSVGSLIPLLFVVSLIVLPIASVFSLASLAVLGLEVSLYLLATVAASLQLAIRNGLRYFPVLPPIFWTIHWALGWGFLIEAMRVALFPRHGAKA
jgi:succinoglycan biosynthesis protein ExoA